MNVTLVGYRGTGKSTVAGRVAEQLGWESVDADLLLEERAGRSIREIFASEGEAGFRDRETEVIEELCRRDRTVIAAGGGAILRAENREALKRSGKIVWLVASPRTIQQRLAQDPTTHQRRPPLTSAGELEEIQHLLSQREPFYRASADMVVDTESRTADEVAQEIVERARLWLLSSPE